MNLPLPLLRFFGLSCEDANRFIIDYLEDTLPLRTRTRFEKHLSQCPLCTIYFDQYRRTIQLVREAGEDTPEPPAELVDLTLSFLRRHLASP